MSKEFASEVQGRLDKGYTLEQALQPLFCHIVLDQDIIQLAGKTLIKGLLFDRLEENFIVAVANNYAEDDVTPIWIAVSENQVLAVAYGVYLGLGTETEEE